jgi:hypothetical protein
VKASEIRHFVAIAGRVLDEGSSRPIDRALVMIDEGPPEFETRRVIWGQQFGGRVRERPDRVLTRADGHFHFLDLPNGHYKICARARGTPANSSVEITIDRRPGETKKPEQADLKLRIPAAIETNPAPAQPKPERQMRSKQKSG